MIYQIFKAYLSSRKDDTAIVDSSGKKYTYFSTYHIVNLLAQYLLEQGVVAHDRVAVLLDNEDLHVFMLLALDRINACYVPFDTDIPRAQLSIDIATLQLKKFIIEDTLHHDFMTDPAITCCVSTQAFLTKDREESEEPTSPYESDGFKKTLYMVSSSGSTGEKKWIPILGAGLSYWALVIKEQMGLTAADKVLATRSPAYDARIFEYLLALSVGGEIHLMPRKQRKDIASIITTCAMANITCVLLIASQLKSELNAKIVPKLKEGGLTHLMVTGDACSPHLKTLCERESINLWNCYGPTEATFGLSVLRVNNLPFCSASEERIVPIGKPYGDDVRYHLIANKLYIESPYLTVGYFKPVPDDTSFCLITNADGNAIRVFDTGDSCYEQDGFIVYKGRAHFDSHCKINGVKVSPILIERCLQAYQRETLAFQAVVVIKPYLGHDTPFAYLVLPADFDKDAFVTYLKGRLKKEEFPILICLDKLPQLFPSEKIDRLALIAREDSQDSFFFNEGSLLRAKYSRDGEGPDLSEWARLSSELSARDTITDGAISDFSTLINNAVLCANHLDQQHHDPRIAPKEKEARVLSLLEAAYHKLIFAYPCFDLLSRKDTPFSDICHYPPLLLSTTAQLFHYYGKALRYRDDHALLEERLALFHMSIIIVQFLEEHISSEAERKAADPNYFNARLLTYRLPIIYTAKQRGQWEYLIRLCEEQLLLAEESHETFHVIQALVQLSDSYLLSGQEDNAFKKAEAAFALVNNAERENTLLFFNALIALMNAADKTRRSTLARELACSVVMREGDEGVALKKHHITAAKKILNLKESLNYPLSVKKIWAELFKRDNLSLDVDFFSLGGHSLMALEMVNKINTEIDDTYHYMTLLDTSEITIRNIVKSIITKYSPPEDHALIHPLVTLSNDAPAIFFLPPLLGDGTPFSYGALARRMVKKFQHSMYGLSDPGTRDSSRLPETLAHAIKRYILAIRSIQPKGPYHLLGFSFGATLAYETARQLMAEGDTIADLHLVDGFPPALYQALSNKAHAKSLEGVLNFLIDIFGNDFYAEHLKPIQLKRFDKLDKYKQIDLAFSTLAAKLTNLPAQRVLALAKQHLIFLLQAEKPHEKLAIWPTLYLTDTRQPYLDIINEVPTLSNISAEYHYFLWTHYFCNLTRCGLTLNNDHLSVLKSGPPLYGKTPDHFWQRAHDSLLHLKGDHYGPQAFYRLEAYDDAHHQLSVFFLTRRSAQYLMKQIKSRGFIPQLSFHDKYLKKYEQGDLIYTSQSNVFVCIPNTALDVINELMERTRIPKQRSPVPGRRTALITTDAIVGTIDLVVIWNRCELLTLSFAYRALPHIIIETLQQRLTLQPVAPSTVPNLIYQHRIIKVGCSIYDAITTVEQFLADLIQVLQPYVIEIANTEDEAPTVLAYHDAKPALTV